MIIALIILWLACGVLHYGWFVYYFQNEFYLIADKFLWLDRGIALVGVLFGPVALFATTIVCWRRKGWML